MIRAGLVFLLISIVGLSPVVSYPQQTIQNSEIIWYRADFPPVTITKGVDAGFGFFDKVTEVLIKHLPEYEHLHHVANFKRIVVDLKNKKNVCCPSLYKTKEREAIISFSIPAVVVLPNVIITRKDLSAKFQPYLDKNAKLELYRLLENTNLRLGISNGRKYSGGIDEIIEPFKGADNVSIRSGEDVFKGLLNMLLLKRIDYTIAYPIEASYFLKGKTDFDEIQIYFIAENKIDFTLGHVGCPKTEWGEKIINSVNHILKAHRQTPEYLGFYEYWLNDETIPIYRKMVRDYFDTEGN